MGLLFDEILFDEEPHTYHFRGELYGSVTQVIRKAGLGDDFSKVNPAVMEVAQRRGRMVHLACQYYDDGDLVLSSVHESILGYVEAYMKFRAQKKIKVIANEKRIISPFGCRNCGHGGGVHTLGGICVEGVCRCHSYTEGLGIAGTPDLVCWMDGARVVIDRKTAQMMSPSMGLQTFGYMEIWNLANPTKLIGERYGIRLSKDGRYKLVRHDDPDDGPAFMDLLHHARSIDRMKKWVTKYAPNA